MHTLAGALHADFRLPGVSYQTLLRATRLFTKSPGRRRPSGRRGMGRSRVAPCS
jgi:hypothetical protein